MSFPDVHFVLPPGLVDRTPYTFVRGKEGSRDWQELGFDHDAVPQGVHDLEGIVNYRLDLLRGVTPGGSQCSPASLRNSAPRPPAFSGSSCASASRSLAISF